MPVLGPTTSSQLGPAAPAPLKGNAAKSPAPPLDPPMRRMQFDLSTCSFVSYSKVGTTLFRACTRDSCVGQVT